MLIFTLQFIAILKVYERWLKMYKQDTEFRLDGIAFLRLSSLYSGTDVNTAETDTSNVPFSCHIVC